MMEMVEKDMMMADKLKSDGNYYKLDLAGRTAIDT